MNATKTPKETSHADQLKKVEYTAKAHTMGGRDGGASRSSDGRLDIKLSISGHSRPRHQSGAVVGCRLVGLFPHKY